MTNTMHTPAPARSPDQGARKRDQAEGADGLFLGAREGLHEANSCLEDVGGKQTDKLQFK